MMFGVPPSVDMGDVCWRTFGDQSLSRFKKLQSDTLLGFSHLHGGTGQLKTPNDCKSVSSTSKVINSISNILKFQYCTDTNSTYSEKRPSNTTERVT